MKNFEMVSTIEFHNNYQEHYTKYDLDLTSFTIQQHKQTKIIFLSKYVHES